MVIFLVRGDDASSVNGGMAGSVSIPRVAGTGGANCGFVGDEDRDFWPPPETRCTGKDTFCPSTDWADI